MNQDDDQIWADIQRKVAEFEVSAGQVGIYHRGYRFWPPYVCGRCGVPVSAKQFAFARCCGGCDTNRAAQTARFGIGDPRWFLGGKAELEDATDRWLIQPQFIPADERDRS
jgi:hypothetical protein